MAPIPKLLSAPVIPAFDEPSIREHVEMLHRLAQGMAGKFVVSTFFANPTGEDKAGGVISHHAVGDVEGMVDAIVAHAETPNANCYICPNLMRPSLGRGMKGSEADVVAVLALVADLDDDTGRSGEMPLEPSYVVESSPGNYQCFLLLDRPLDPAEAKPIARSLKLAANADHCTIDISHVWRVPGCLNWPNAKKLARGRPPEPASVTIAEPWDGSLISVDELRTVLEPWQSNTESHSPVTIGDLPSLNDFEISARAAEMLAADDVGDRSHWASKVVEQLAFDGLTAEQACAAFLSATGNWFARYASRDPRIDFIRLWSKFGAHHADDRAAAARASSGIIASASRRIATPVAANDNHVDDEDDGGDEPDSMDVIRSGTAGLPVELCYPPGAVGEFARFIVGCARFPSPHLALVASLAFTAGLIGRRFKGPTGLRSNIYLVGLAESGFGKDATIRASAALADSTSWGDKVSEWLFMDQIRSLPGLTNKLRKSPSSVCIQDEFGRWLADHTGRNVATHRAEIASALMELTGAPQGFWGGHEKAAGNVARIVAPCFTLHGVSTPSTFWAALSSGNISEGLLGRLVLIDVGNSEPVKVRKPPNNIDSIPVRLSNMVADLLGLSAGRFTGPFFALNAKSDEKPHPIMTAEWGEGVDDLFEEFDDRIRGMKKSIDPQYRPILNRVGENAARLALIVAVGCDPKEPVITREIQEWANAVAENSLQTILRGADGNIADNDRAAEYLRVRAMITRKGESGMTVRAIIKQLRGSIEKRRLEDILGMLRQSQEVHLAKLVVDSGQTQTRYWLASAMPSSATIVPL
ncbi:MULTISPECIES: DNA-primase RepB domain-containing protein [unclassified Rhizobium]|nr:DNA-primase RepB domain-containing protein [Rhizobium sp. 16-488-2b]MBO9175450.1 hypothetical protein [Rhizobium sp. 16-488-2a]